VLAHPAGFLVSRRARSRSLQFASHPGSVRPSGARAGKMKLKFNFISAGAYARRPALSRENETEIQFLNSG
jgi:hypothetical protein